MSDTENIAPEEDLDETDPRDERRAALDAERAEIDAKSDAELVAERSADTDELATDEHVKVFVLPPGPKPTEANGYAHEANMAATRQYMISQGLRPTGDVRHVSTKAFGPGGKSWAITYAVPAVPAERFDFQQPVTVITENEDPDGDGQVSGQSGETKTEAETPPTERNTRKEIDAYAASKGVDTSAATTKAEALALLTKPTA